VPDPETGKPRRLAPAANRGEIEVCARCHSRRSPLGDGSDAGHPLLDTHLPALLDDELYFPDGQIRGEVFEVGSFLQSQMHRQGVTCSDCHEPHDLTLRAVGNDLCTRCHAAARFDTPEHHFHAAGSAGASCVECHMPARTYMEVDPRRDHSLRVPRPDLTLRLGTPNPCNGCHRDRSPQWAAAAVEGWRGGERSREPHWGEAVAAARRGLPGAGEALLAVASDPRQAPIVRATALAELRRDPPAASSPEVAAATGDPNPLLRLGAARALAAAPPEIRLRRAAPLLRDPRLAVRLEAARTLAGLPSELLTAHGTETQEDLAAALAELEAAQRANAEQPEARLALGWLALVSGDLPRAETAYRRALDLDPGFTAAAVNLAEVYRRQGRDEEGEPLLRASLERDPAAAGVHHALGLLLVRRGRLEEALGPLGRAAELAPDEPRYITVFEAALAASSSP
jgi:predicted CXXCH cytochrome family protein